MVSLGFDLAGFRRDVGAAESGLDDLGGAADQAGTRISDSLKNLGGAVAGGVLASEFAGAFGEGLNIESGRAKLAAQLNLSSEDAALAGQVAGDIYGQGWGESLDQVNEAVRGVAGNMNVEMGSVNMEPLARQATILSDVFGIDLADSTRAAGNLMKHLGMDGQAAMDTIARVTQNGGARAEDLVDTLEEYPVQFQKLGLSGEQAMGILNQGLEAGARNTDIVGDALKEFSIRAIDGSKTSAEGFALMGLNAEQMTAQIARGGPEASAGLQTVTDALRNMEDPVARDAAAVALFGTQAEDLGAVLGAINPATAVASLGDFSGAVDTAGNTASDTAQGKILPLQRGFEAFMQSLVAAPGPLGVFGAGLMTFGPQALTMISSIGMIVMAFGPLIGGFLRTTVSLVGTVARWGVLFGKLGLIVAKGVLLMLFDLGKWAVQTLVQGAIAVANLTKTAVLYAAQWAWMGLKALFNAGKMALAWIIAMGPIGWVIAAVVGLVVLIIANWDKVSAWTAQAWAAVTGFISDAWNNITSWVSGAVAAVIGFVTGAWANVTSATSTAWQAVLGFITGAWNNITSWVSGAIDNVVSFIRTGWDNATRTASEAWNNIVNAVRNGANNVLNFVRGLPGQILGALGNLGSLLFNAGRDVVMGLWNGIVGMGSWLYGRIMGWIRNVVPGPILQFLGIASPSKWMRDEVGKWIPEGIADGIIANARVAANAARELASDTADAAQSQVGGGMLSDIGRAAEEILGQMTRGGSVFEDLTFKGASSNVGAWNDELLNRADAAGVDARGMKAWLSEVVASERRGGSKTVNINNYTPLPERASDSIGRAGSTLAAVGPWGDD